MRRDLISISKNVNKRSEFDTAIAFSLLFSMYTYTFNESNEMSHFDLYFQTTLKIHFFL